MSLTAHVVDLPLTTRFRGIARRHAVLLTDGDRWAEWSPFPEYDDGEAATWLGATMESLTRDAPPPVREAVPVNAIIPALPPESAAKRALASGCLTAKVKVAAPGETLDDDVARVAAVRNALGSGGRIRVDANGGWDLSTAREAVRELAQFDLEYVEQPCATVEDLVALRRAGSPVLIAADESIRRADDPLRVVAAGAADVAIIKVQPLGGIRRCLDLVDELGLPVVVSSALETSLGLLQGLRLAAALPDLPFACGLETAALLRADVTTEPVLPVGGVLYVRDVVVDPSLVESAAADEATTLWWLARLDRVASRLPTWPGRTDAR